MRAAKTPDLETFNRSLELTAPQEQLFSLQLTRIARYGRFPSSIDLLPWFSQMPAALEHVSSLCFQVLLQAPDAEQDA